MDEIDGRIAAAALETIAMERPTLRDWFAMAAMASFDTSEFNSWEAQAASAYTCADAMLKARAK